MQQFTTELEAGSTDAESDVKVQGLISQAGHGFPAYLTKAALKKVDTDVF